MNNYKYIDVSYLIDIANGNNRIIKEIIDLFKIEIQKNIETMESCILESDMKSLSAIAHKSKSSVKVMGLNTLSKKLKEVEFSAKDGIKLDSHSKVLELFKSTFHGAMIELENFASTL